MESLSERGYGDEQLSEIRRMIDAEKSDLFDVLAYVAFALAPITREERVATRKSGILSRYDDDKLQAFLDFVLGQYVTQGVHELALEKLGGLIELKYGSTSDAAAELGGVETIRETFVGFQRHLYER